MQFIAQLTAISIFILMFVGILSEKFERHQVSLFCGAAMLIIVVGVREDEEVYEIAHSRRTKHDL